MPRPLPPSFNLDDAIRRYLAGEPSSKIAASVGINRVTLDRKLRERGVPPQRVREWVDLAVALHLDGVPQSEIGRRVNRTQAVVSYALLNRGYRTDRSAAERRKWQRMTETQRAAQVQAAHDAVRGTTKTAEALRNAAKGRQRTQRGGTDNERDIIDALADLGIYGVGQQAVGKYNLDIGCEPVAVELFGGNWHAYGRHRARLPQRVKDLADAGWNLLIAWTRGDVHPLNPAAVAQDVRAYFEQSRRDPAFRRQYRVIWGDGQPVASGGVDDHQVTLIPPGIRSQHTGRR